MNSLKKKIKKPAKFIIKEVYCEDSIKKKVHKGGNKEKIYGKLYLPKEWIGKEVYIGLIKK